MYEYQRRLLNEAAKYGKLSPKETQNLPEECRDFIVEGVNVMKGAEKLVLNSGLDVGTYRKLLNVLRNRLGGHAMILDITKPTGPGAARGGLTGEGSEIKIVKIADIGKYEFNGYDFKGIKLGNKAERTWKDHKGQAIIIALNESVQEEAETVSEASGYVDLATKNLEVSTKLALKKDKKHDSQWGFGYRAYLRAFIKGNASAIKKIDSPEQKAGFVAAHKDVASLTPLKEEVESLEEAYKRGLGDAKNWERVVNFIKSLPAPVTKELKALSSKVGGLKPNTMIDTQVKAILVKHKVKFFVEPSVKPSLEDTVNLITYMFDNAISHLERQTKKEEVENLEEAAPVKASKSQIDDFKSKVLAYYTAHYAKARNIKDPHEYSRFMSGMFGSNVVGRTIDDWAKETGGDVTKLTNYFNPGSRNKTKFDIPPINDFVKKVFGNFKLVNDTLVKEETETNEAYAPNWAYAQRKQHPILGQFKHKGNTFEYRAIVKGASPGSDWALSHGMTHEIFLRPVWNDYRDVRFAIVKATVVQVAVDEGEGGKPVYEKWPITGHKKYPTESTEIQTNEAVTPNWAKSQAKQHPILGQFKYKNETFEYRAVVKGTPDSDWALKNGLYYEVFMKPMYNDHRDVRFANIKRMEAYIAMDKGDDGKPVLKKLDLTMHQRYPEPKRF